MSPLSEKYFQYRMQQQQQPPDAEADRDRYCPVCGYNLRGLPSGRACPECGSSGANSPPDSSSSGSSRNRAKVMPDPLLATSDEDRRRWHVGLGLATVALAVVLVSKWLIFLGLVFGITSVAYPSIIALMVSMTLVWIPAVWLATPASLGSFVQRGDEVRWFIRLTQLLWMPGYVLVAMRLTQYAGTNMEAQIHVLSLLVRGVAGIGFLVFLWLMMRIAHFAELEDASRRFNNAIFFLPLPAMIVAAVYGFITWLAAVLLGLVLVAWTWLMMYLVLGCHQMYQHVRWARREAFEAAEREQRVHATREQLDRHVQSRIRPTGSTPSEQSG